jgi:hypothetical protein
VGGDGSEATDKKAGLVLQNNVAVGVEIPQNLGRIGIINLVPNEGGRRGLKKGGGLANTDVKASPIDEGAV